VKFGSGVDPTFTLGTTEPTWANSGCRIPQSSLTTNLTTNLITTADNQVISGLYLPKGRIEVRHKNVTIRDCIINIGYDANRQHIQKNCAIVHNLNFDTSNNVIQFVTVDPVNAGVNGTPDDADVAGIFGFGFTAYRCAIRNVTDGFMPDVRAGFMGPSTIQGNYIATRWLAYDPSQSDGTHNDGVQLAGGDRHVIEGNSIHNPTGGVIDPGSGSTVRGQCVVLTPYHAALTNTTIKNNWFYGSYTQVASWIPATYYYGPSSGINVTGNRHGGQCVWPILFDINSNANKGTVSGNIAAAGGVKWNFGTTAAGSAIYPNFAAA
jgi:hypothetical protein